MAYIELTCCVCGYVFEEDDPRPDGLEPPCCPDSSCRRLLEESRRDNERAREISHALFAPFERTNK